MKRNKTISAAFAVLLCAVCLSGCGSSTVHGTEGMLTYMCERHGEGLEYSGCVSNAAETVAWFTFDEVNPTCSYMIFKNKGNDKFEPSYDPNYTMSADVCWCLWDNGAAIHIENTDIAEVTVLSGRAETFQVTEYPYNAYVELEGGLNGIYCVNSDGEPVGEL